jgi:DNA (cytosine-5)-methyltransferase 1
MSHIYRRLEADKPAYTITGSGGGGTHVYHWEEHRALTNEERAALQTFPPDFKFIGTPEQIRKQIGMAVPTTGAKAIFEAILKTFAKVTYDSIEPDPQFIFLPDKLQRESK